MSKRKKPVVWHVYREPVSTWYVVRRDPKSIRYALFSHLEWSDMRLPRLKPGECKRIRINVEVVT